MFAVSEIAPSPLRRGALALAATTIVVGVILITDAEPASVMLGIALTSSLSRSQLEKDRRGRLEALWMLPVLGVVSVGLGVLLRTDFWIGAIVYTAALTAVTALRGAGAWGRRIAGIAATPLLATLFLPAGAGADHGPVLALLEPLIIALFSWAVVTVVHLAARRPGVLPASSAQRQHTLPPPSSRPRSRPSATMRMTAQVAVATATSFVIGGIGFGSHWAWVVLSTVIVAFLPRGRADAISKGVHRLLGAAAGSLVALVPLHATADVAPAITACALAAVGVGILVREFGYALWAFTVTIALTLLEALQGQAAPLIGVRLIEIAVGVGVGVLAVCLVWPIRTADVVRAQLAVLLAAVSDRLAAETGEERSRTDRRIATGLSDLDRASAPLREAARACRALRLRPPDAVAWARDALVIASAAQTAGESGSSGLRRAVGEARRTLTTPSELGDALRRAAQAAGPA